MNYRRSCQAAVAHQLDPADNNLWSNVFARMKFVVSVFSILTVSSCMAIFLFASLEHCQ